jgi:hypothetical protein
MQHISLGDAFRSRNERAEMKEQQQQEQEKAAKLQKVDKKLRKIAENLQRDIARQVNKKDADPEIIFNLNGVFFGCHDVGPSWQSDVQKLPGYALLHKACADPAINVRVDLLTESHVHWRTRLGTRVPAEFESLVVRVYMDQPYMYSSDKLLLENMAAAKVRAMTATP